MDRSAWATLIKRGPASTREKYAYQILETSTHLFIQQKKNWKPIFLLREVWTWPTISQPQWNSDFASILLLFATLLPKECVLIHETRLRVFSSRCMRQLLCNSSIWLLSVFHSQAWSVPATTKTISPHRKKMSIQRTSSTTIFLLLKADFSTYTQYVNWYYPWTAAYSFQLWYA